MRTLPFDVKAAGVPICVLVSEPELFKKRVTR